MFDAAPTLCAPSATDDPSTDADAEGARPSAERQLQLLGELAEFGLEIARAIAAEAKTAEADLNAMAMAYARVARAVRLTVMLRSRLIGELEAYEAAAARKVDRAPADCEAGAHKARVERIVGRVAKAAIDDEDEVDNLVFEARERLDDDDVYGDVLSRPVGELVALVCRDLGLDPDWSALAEEAWAKAEIAGGAAGSPFTALLRTRLPCTDQVDRRMRSVEGFGPGASIPPGPA